MKFIIYVTCLSVMLVGPLMAGWDEVEDWRFEHALPEIRAALEKIIRQRDSRRWSAEILNLQVTMNIRVDIDVVGVSTTIYNTFESPRRVRFAVGQGSGGEWMIIDSISPTAEPLVRSNEKKFSDDPGAEPSTQRSVSEIWYSPMRRTSRIIIHFDPMGDSSISTDQIELASSNSFIGDSRRSSIVEVRSPVEIELIGLLNSDNDDYHEALRSFAHRNQVQVVMVHEQNPDVPVASYGSDSADHVFRVIRVNENIVQQDLPVLNPVSH